MIKISNLKFSYSDGQEVFNGLDFEYSPGSRVGFMGPNGSGKTTLLRLITGLLKPLAGRIEIFSKPRKTEKDFAEVRKRIGFLFQDPDNQLFCPTVREEIAFGPLNLGKSENEVEKIVDKTCGSLGISNLKDKITLHLSGGEKRLVAFASVVSMSPEILLLDEPTNDLDSRKKEIVIEYLKNSCGAFILVAQDTELFRMLRIDKFYKLGNSKLKLL